MAGQYKRGELFRRYHLVNIDNNVIEESSEVADSALVECDNQSGFEVFRGLNRSTLTHITGKLPLKMTTKGKSRLQPLRA